VFLNKSKRQRKFYTDNIESTSTDMADFISFAHTGSYTSFTQEKEKMLINSNFVIKSKNAFYLAQCEHATNRTRVFSFKEPITVTTTQPTAIRILRHLREMK